MEEVQNEIKDVTDDAIFLQFNKPRESQHKHWTFRVVNNNFQRKRVEKKDKGEEPIQSNSTACLKQERDTYS